MTDVSNTVAALLWQAGQHDTLGARFGAEFMRRAAADVEAGGPFATLFAPWAETDMRAQIADAVPLRMLAAFNDLVLDGVEPALTSLSPPAAWVTDWGRLWPLTLDVARTRADRLAAFMTHEPQTNEVRRAMALVGGFLTVAAETGLPLRTLEIGASAGLNLNWDRFGYRFGLEADAPRWGAPVSPLQLDAAWSGPPPPRPMATVIERSGCDRRPIRLEDPVERRRLEAYVWPEQPDRLARMRAAIAVLLASDAHVEAADAAAWAEAVLAPRRGVATVFYHSVVSQYLPPATRERVEAAVDRAGAAAAADGPFAWLRMEPSGEPAGEMAVDLTLWPGGRTRRLALSHPHGAAVRWIG